MPLHHSRWNGLFQLAPVALLLAACATTAEPPPPSCTSHGFAVIPTPTRGRDPDLSQPPQPPPGGGDPAGCPPPATPPVALPGAAAAWQAGQIVNLTLDAPDQALTAATVGDDRWAAAWESAGQVVVALARGGRLVQTRRVDRGGQGALAFSPVNRLHLVYEQDGRVVYRAAEEGVHPADAPEQVVDVGRAPQVVVDEQNWAHVLYTRDGRLYHARHLSGTQWLIRSVGEGERFRVTPFYSDGAQPDGIPAGAYWFGLYVVVTDATGVRVLRYLSWFNVWEQRAVLASGPGETAHGVGRAAALTLPDGSGRWAAVAWIGRQPGSPTAAPAYGPPRFEAANPLYPHGLGNPQQIHSGLNAARWQADPQAPQPFAAGLRQTTTPARPGRPLRVTAWGLGETPGEDGLWLRLGLDPQGGRNPDAPGVRWAETTATGTYQQLQVEAETSGTQVTVFLHGELRAVGRAGTVVWDDVQLENGHLQNGDLEGAFTGPAGRQIPAGWTAYEADGSLPTGGAERPRDTVYGAWSADGGRTWSAVQALTGNRLPGSGVSGALAPVVYPLLGAAQDGPTLSLVTVYETGDPPAGTTFLRYGRPVITRCAPVSGVCSAAPGNAVLPRRGVRPTLTVAAAADPLDGRRALLVWDGRQRELEQRDVYATWLVERE